ncbi:chemotaxis protein CheB [Hymenobacter psychrophilus]|uniref:protein-glutamate methylesterase n=1 Tax=Hymenobacter psychrophilus TaxID=651662 RepID=A0A1H3MWR5_9BACT|nr:chemotaxis protein CheB [Hymenobacter psychrophilus]SDY81121.1 two-component system, chemotaxis family, response regulator CheB [Hymenobacter psychrophilus]
MATPSFPKTGQPLRDVVVIGASAGGVTALLALAKTLPTDFPAPIFVVLHVAADSPSIMPQLINSVSALHAKHPENGEVVQPGVIYLAPPDHHLLLEDDRVLVTRGPKENRFRPSIDALFRSAAYTYGPRVLGVVLTGYLDDGTSGLWSVQRMGGLAIVQDPRDAEQPAMPTNALEFVTADYLVPLVELGSLLVRLTQEPAPAPAELPADQLDLLQIEVTIAKQGGGFELGIIDKGHLTPFTCPECHGALTQLIEGQLIRYRCHTGHAYTVSALLSEVTESVESLLYQSLRGLEETQLLLQNLGAHFQTEKQAEVAALFLRKAAETGQRARLVHDSILQHEALSGDLQFYQKELA